MDRILDYWYKDLEGLLAGQIAKEHINQPAFSHALVDFVIGAGHGQGSFRAGVKIIFSNDDGSIEATEIYGLGEIECQKDTAELLALVFTPKLNATLKQIIYFVRGNEGQLVSNGTLAVYKKENLPRQGEERETEEAGERNPQGEEGKAPSDRTFNQGAEGDPETDDAELVTSTFYAILDRTGPLGDDDTLVLNVPSRVFVTGDLPFYAAVVGKEGMDKAHCHWCKLRSVQWQTYGHAPGSKWTLGELKRVAGTITPTKRSQNGVKNYPQLDCVELERYIFPVLHVTLGLANRLLKHPIDYADLVVERTPEFYKRQESYK
jgi:hypothetical protein